MRNTFISKQYRWFLILAFIACSCLPFCTSCSSQSTQRILIITGGHEFEREAFFELFDEMPGIAYREVIHPEVNQLYDSILIDQVDVLLFYDMFQEIDDTEKAAFMKLLEEGKGMIFLHHSLANYQEWEEFEKVIGGRYILSDQGGSTYRHDVEMPVHVVDKKHPLTRGVDDFMIHDEVYGNFRVLPTVSPLLTTTHPESSDTIAWTNKYGDSRIVYIQLGHDHHAYEDPNFRILLKQAIDWVQ